MVLGVFDYVGMVREVFGIFRVFRFVVSSGCFVSCRLDCGGGCEMLD